MLKIGDQLPEITFQLLNDEGGTTPTTHDLFANRKVVLFAVPGAFTPTCSNAHLPGFVANSAEIKSKGVDSIICLSVNDSFVMKAWGEANNVGDIVMLADGAAAFTKAIGLDMETGDFGGTRSKRYSMLVDNGVVIHLNVEPPQGGLDVSSAEVMLTQIR
ncbi:peroxiredoxin [Candidatus Endobugula sertula]|uniref:Glutathione-dependent peroxiredoxin n=1 Tax=Candidatus Endobugula sertula TaxID=62101 RepID=A0A1D2QRR4_9GAMM|nr:peroxiredoxin [Candidatus Endobugula sertula]